MNKPTKTILIVGETGTGKSALINTMVNFVLGVQWEDRVWFQIMAEDSETSQAKSKTSAITVYELFLETSPLCLRIIDTPGYGDTNGADQTTGDNLHVLFRSEDGIHEIEAVGLVLKASQNRLTEFQHYILNSVLSLFAKDIKENLILFITHSDGLPAPNVITAVTTATVPCAKDSSGKPLHFMFNNRQHEDYEKEHEELHQVFWNLGLREMERFFWALKDFKRIELKMTNDVMTKRNMLNACIHNFQDAIKMGELKQIELKQTQKALEMFDKDFSYEVDEPFKDRVIIDSSRWSLTKLAMCCTICKENCHYPGCWWTKNLSWCEVMKDGKCMVCTNKCPVSCHIKENKIYVPKTRKVKKTAETLITQYQSLVDIEKALLKELDDEKLKKSQLLEEAYECIMELEKIVLKKDSSLLAHVDFLLEKIEQRCEKVEKLERLKKQIATSQDNEVGYFKAHISKVSGKKKCLSKMCILL